MKKLFFETEKDGFYGTYYENPNRSDCAVIGLFGDDPNDYMAKCGAKWLHKNGVNALCMSPGKKNYSHVNYPLERIGAAIQWLKKNGNRKIGIMGMSTAGMDSLVAASYFSDITLTFGLTPSDFVWQGFEQGKKDGCREWPVPGASTLSWKGKPLAYMPFVYEHGTHFVLPESLLRMALPVGLKFVLRFIFRAAKEYPDACEATRIDIDRKLSAALKEWREE